MSTSLRARRMARNHRRLATPAKLNLVALMDIFTILVLFLIVNNGDVEVLQTDKRVALPESVSEQRPEATLIVKVTDSDILLDERAIMSLEDVSSSDQAPLLPLQNALALASMAQPALVDERVERGRPIVVMGDEKTPYSVLKKVLATCAASDYRHVSLAVNSKPVSVVEGDAMRPSVAMAGADLASEPGALQ